MTKKDIVLQVAEQAGITQTLAKEAVQQLFNTIIETVSDSGRLELRGFGVFEVKHRAGRKGRNPKTGTEVTVPPKDVVIFKAGKEMQDKISRKKTKKRKA